MRYLNASRKARFLTGTVLALTFNSDNGGTMIALEAEKVSSQVCD